MFNKRQNSQKPNREFLSHFQESFRDAISLCQSGSSPRPHCTDSTENNSVIENSQIKIKARDAPSSLSSTDQGTPFDIHDLNPTPSWIGFDSYSSLSHGPQYPGLYTPKSGGMGTIFHSQVGDLHTPTGMYTKNHLSLSSALQTPLNYSHPVEFESFNSQYVANDTYGTYTDNQPASCASSVLMHHDSEFKAMKDSADDFFLDGTKIDISNARPSMDLLASSSDDASCSPGEKFRFHVSLLAPTAMVETPNDIPITYLNKGQSYKISATDLNPPMITGEPIRYRTVIRVLFENEEQRMNPLASWELWKEARGLSEAHQRDGKLLAVECLNSGQSADADANAPCRVQVEKNFVDGFCVSWSPKSARKTSGCDMFVRFNFLSTDFSRSKGVKGATVRICAKTELLSPSEESGVLRDAELSYCKVKLFRDHGAERKQSHDIVHVNKSIGKLKRQIAEAEISGGFAKRKRYNKASATDQSSDRPAKLGKHGHTLSGGTATEETISLKADFQSKLATTEYMFSSTRPVSIFDLRGEELDDPDLYPIMLPGSGEYVNCKETSQPNADDLHAAVSTIPTPPSTRTSLTPRLPHNFELTKSPPTMQGTSFREQVSKGLLEVMGIEPSYSPPVESPSKSIACLYARLSGTEQPPDYYRAIYLQERTIGALINSIADKYSIDPTRIAHIMHVNKDELRIKVDDDVVRHLPEGQDMVMEIIKAPGSDCIPDNMSESLLEIQLVF